MKCGIPLVFVFPSRRVNAYKTATHNVKSCFRLLQECLSVQRENAQKLVFLSETKSEQ